MPLLGWNGRNLRLVATGPENLRPEGAKQFQNFPYFFGAYKFNPEHQLVTSFSVMNAVREGANDGWLAEGCGEVGGDVCVTDSSADIASYIGSLDEAALFKDQCIFRKVE